MNPVTRRLTEMTTTEVSVDAGSKILVIPLGSTEQHGPHLPLDTDTRITEALVHTLSLAYPDRVVLAPTINYGSSGEHSHFDGTLSLSNEALAEVIRSIVLSASSFRSTLLVTAHGGNAPIAQRVVNDLRTLGVRTGVWFPTRATIVERTQKLMVGGSQAAGALDPDLHAGRTETSIMLALDASRVRVDRAQAGPMPIDELRVRSLYEQGVHAVSKNGVMGDPSGASKEEGALLLGIMSEALIDFFARKYL
ncbi:creatinine amidohydrolase [Ferrithrix thermotolerans DSM 19514]|uniref:Creatinine amidohydrolase n=1 Tax=Ferrithrix thermotolerans DSM 19514 TaxID=1121881 RepID=A0A1M4WGB2_9ACTN|nr:mycofactocin biosynthesis peptidyl-dipeptidase MftE [Ferrithrix thermotolerans]SHE80288.1 creatinine amidohydrolase [Ferrithrix thermotolerans DSM 19514]